MKCGIKYKKLLTIIFLSVAVVLCSLVCYCIANAQESEGLEPNVRHHITGTIIENGSQDPEKPLAGVKVDAFSGPYSPDMPKPISSTYTDSDGKFDIQILNDGICLTLQFYYKDDNKLSKVYAGNRIYIDTPVTTDIDLDKMDPRPDLSLHKYTNNISGFVKEKDTCTGISGAAIEFYNPYGLSSPYADLTVYTDENGYFTLEDTIGMPSNIECYAVASYDGSSAPLGSVYDNYTSVTHNDLIFYFSDSNLLCFELSKQTNIKIFDRNQGEETFFTQCQHKLYINGILQDKPGLLGDTTFNIRGDYKISVVQDCTLKLTYYVDGDTYEETMEPARYKSEAGWIPTYKMQNYKASRWQLWEKSYDNPEIKCFQNFEYSGPQSTGYLLMDVYYEEAVAPLNISYPADIHDYFDVTQTFEGQSYNYQCKTFFQESLFENSVIYVDENNNLNIESSIDTSNSIQHTVVRAVGVAGYDFVNWSNEDQVITPDSETIIAKQAIPINLEVNYAAHSDEPTKPEVTPATEDTNYMFIFGLLGLSICCLTVMIKGRKSRV